MTGLFSHDHASERAILPRNQILCGDSVEVLRGFPGRSIDLAVMDPPYLANYRDRYGRTLANDDNPDAVLAVYEALYRVMKPDTYCVTFYGWPKIAEFTAAWTDAGFRTVGHIVWPKPYACSSGHTEVRHESAFVLAKGWPCKPSRPIRDVQAWEFSGNRAHPTEKAVSVIAPLIRAFSRPGDVVIDPFLGSGTTAVAAALTGRAYIGIELEERYCDLARRRLAGVSRKLEPA